MEFTPKGLEKGDLSHPLNMWRGQTMTLSSPEVTEGGRVEFRWSWRSGMEGCVDGGQQAPSPTRPTPFRNFLLPAAVIQTKTSQAELGGLWTSGCGTVAKSRGRGTARTGRESAWPVLPVHALCAQRRLEIATFCRGWGSHLALGQPFPLLLCSSATCPWAELSPEPG